MSYYENYEKILKRKNLRDSDIARAAGVRPETLSGWKSGRYTPRVQTLIKIADCLDVALDTIVGRNILVDDDEF